MKKFLILSVTMLVLTSCSCLLSQVPPQYVYAGVGCQAPLPDYRPYVVAEDNCGNVTLTQTPAAGAMLTENVPVVSVVIRGTDRFNNTSAITFTVTLIDTVPPVLNWPAGQIAMGEDGAMQIYKNWVEAVKVHGIAKWMADLTWTQGMQFADTVVYQNMKYFNHNFAITDQELADYISYLNSH